MTDFSHSIVEVTQAIVDLLTGEKDNLGLAKVSYGLPDLIEVYPIAAVEPLPMERTLSGGASTHRWEITHNVAITIGYGLVRQGSELNEKENQALAIAVTDVLHTDKKLGGLVIFGFVIQEAPGERLANGVKIRATRLLWQGISRQDF